MGVECEANMPTMMPAEATDRSLRLKSRSTDRGAHATEEPAENRKASAVKVPPQATEGEWKLRLGKRQRAIESMKSSPIYFEHQDIPRDKRPHTPDAFTRDLSKRVWESEVSKW